MPTHQTPIGATPVELEVEMRHVKETADERHGDYRARFDSLDAKHDHLDRCIDAAKVQVALVAQQVALAAQDIARLRRTNDRWGAAIIVAIVAAMAAHLGLK